MDASTRPGRDPAGSIERRSTRAVFFVAGFGTAAWAPLVPYAKARLGLDAGTLGLLLLCLGIGSIVTMPLTGALTAKFGCRRVIRAAGLLVVCALPWLTTSNATALAVALLAFGAGLGAFDVAINVQAVIVERDAGGAMMSGFHAQYSIGGLVGAGTMTGLLWIGLAPLPATLCVCLVVIGMLAAFGPHLLATGGEADAHAFALPRGLVVAIGLLCFIVFLAEGAMLDWSAVVMTSLHDVRPTRAGLAYAAFAVAMAIGRLSGDRLVRMLGGSRILQVGGLCASSGLAMAALARPRVAALLGFAMVGLGCSNIVPVLFSALGRQRIMPPNLAVAAASTLGFAGILLGPALIGFIAQLSSLPIALTCVSGMLLALAASARVAR